MPRPSRSWTLERLIDFEHAASSSQTATKEVRHAVFQSIHGMDGAKARRTGMLKWLEETGDSSAGRKFSSALSLVAVIATGAAFISGASAVLGFLDRTRGGIDVPLFLAILIGAQWLILVFALIAWLMRRKAAEGFSTIQFALGRLVRKLAGQAHADVWDKIFDAGGESRQVVLWRLARLAQGIGISFNLGIIGGLSGLVLVRHVGFYWETTTELAMQSILEKSVQILSAPWSTWWPGAVPDSAIIQASRWTPGSGTLSPGPAAWWEFLLMATLFWGLAPRVILWMLAWKQGKKALATLDFQARHHRALWREITTQERASNQDEKPLDGVLVLDVGGSGIQEEALRTFLLRRLRVHPSAWQPISVMDPREEEKAAALISAAPAGIVLLSEGWSLSPPRMLALHRKLRESAGPNAPIKFLVANTSAGGTPVPPSNDEQQEWARFVDSLRDPAAEIYFFAKDYAAL